MTGPPRRNEPPNPGGAGRFGSKKTGSSTFSYTANGPRRQVLVAHLHAAGPRPVLEALLELERGGNLDEILERFARVPVSTYRAIGADRFAPLPLHLIEAA